MTEAIYKVGDILEVDGNASFPRQFGMFPKDAKIRCMVLKCIKPGYEFITYTLLVHKIDGSFDTVGINQKDLAIAAKRVGHIDISSFLSDEESAEPDYAMLFAVGTIAQSVDLKNELDKIKKENEKLKAERDEANHEISRLRTVVGGLNDVLDDLHASTVEVSNLFSFLTTVLQTDDILEGVNKLKKENERLSNENGDLKTMNDELRKSIPEYNELVLKHFACTEKIKKLEDENARYLQSMTCAEKQMTEAAQRIHESMEHLNVALCDNE